MIRNIPGDFFVEKKPKDIHASSKWSQLENGIARKFRSSMELVYPLWNYKVAPSAVI